MSKPNPKIRLLLSVSPELLDKIETFRGESKNRNAAIVELLERSLRNAAKRETANV